MADFFVDRQANRPNRYKVIPDSGSAYYVTLERADEPSVLGTPINAENLNMLYGTHNARLDFKIYASLADIGLSAGSETIAAVAGNLPNQSVLIFSVTTSNAAIYPTSYGLVTVKRTSSTRISFEFLATSGVSYNGFYSITNNGDTWTGWMANAVTATVVPTSVE